jgi:tRNA A-37 threonylcarbamoyl transferase component Bud32
VVCRVIEFERMTNYILEDYLNELMMLDSIKMKGFTVPTLGYHIKASSMMIFYPEMVSLFDLLYSKDKAELLRQLDSKNKYHVCYDIARIMYTFHQFNPPICHGHLTSHNIFLETQ